jgi:hypothetical protein
VSSNLLQFKTNIWYLESFYTFCNSLVGIGSSRCLYHKTVQKSTYLGFWLQWDSNLKLQRYSTCVPGSQSASEILAQTWEWWRSAAVIRKGDLFISPVWCVWVNRTFLFVKLKRRLTQELDLKGLEKTEVNIKLSGKMRCILMKENTDCWVLVFQLQHKQPGCFMNYFNSKVSCSKGLRHKPH